MYQKMYSVNVLLLILSSASYQASLDYLAPLSGLFSPIIFCLSLKKTCISLLFRKSNTQSPSLGSE